MANSVLQIIFYVLIIIFIIFLIRYLWDLIFEKNQYNPVQWDYKKKAGEISNQLIHLEKNFPDKVRFLNFWYQIERIKNENIKGSFAELGVYKGETAKIIHEMDNTRKFHLFDTFEGYSKKDIKNETGEAATYTSKNFSNTSIDAVKEYIDGNGNLIFLKGHFPESTYNLKNETYSLVTMDANLYNSTKDGLEYFYPKLSEGGVIIVHDYNHKWEGLMKAVDEFVKKIPESLIPLPDMYCSVMIIKNK